MYYKKSSRISDEFQVKLEDLCTHHLQLCNLLWGPNVLGKFFGHHVKPSRISFFTNVATKLGQSTSAQRSLTSIKNSHSYDQLSSDFYQLNVSTEPASRAVHFLSGSYKDAVAWISCILSDPQYASLLKNIAGFSPTTSSFLSLID